MIIIGGRTTTKTNQFDKQKGKWQEIAFAGVIAAIAGTDETTILVAAVFFVRLSSFIRFESVFSVEMDKIGKDAK